MTTPIQIDQAPIPAILFKEGTAGNGRLYATDANGGQLIYRNRGGTEVVLSQIVLTKAQIDALNINADTVDGQHASAFALASALTGKLDISALLSTLLTVDGAGSLLDADKLDGQEGSYYATGSSLSTHVGDITTHSNFTTQRDLAQWNANKLQGRPITTATPASNDIPVWNGTEWTYVAIPAGGGGGGSTDTASNLGTGTGVFYQKNAGDFQFKSLKVTAPLAISNTATDITLDINNISADKLVDGTTNKAYTATEKTKLAGIATAATANSSDATLLARANHTGTQPASTISDFTTAVNALIMPTPDSTSVVTDTTSLTLATSHVGKSVLCNNTGDCVLTIPTQASSGIQPGATISFRKGSGSFTFAQVSTAITLNGSTTVNKSMSTRYFWATLFYEGNDVWNLSGAIS